MADASLVTISTFKNREYLIKMNVVSNTTLDLSITDKYTGEEWNCNYDATYIENVTHRTGNFKQFHIFITMLKSGLLKTSECVTLDLLTFEDLEILKTRNRKPFFRGNVPNSSNLNNNRRYLILTYSVEFDRIHYPLPLDYYGPPDPQIMQANIRRLENEVLRLQEQLADCQRPSIKLQQRISDLTEENQSLREEIKVLRCNNRTPSNQMHFMHNAIETLENSVLNERNSHKRVIKELKDENLQLRKQITALKEQLSLSAIQTIRTARIQKSEPGLSLLFLNKSSTNKLGGGRKIKSNRSEQKLPHMSKFESWEATLRGHNVECPVKRNRSNSHESIPVGNNLLPLTTRRTRSRTKGQKCRSRSGSNASIRSRKSSTDSVRSSKRKLNKSDSRNGSYQEVNTTANELQTDYGFLQNRIRDLQNLLTDNLNI